MHPILGQSPSKRNFIMKQNIGSIDKVIRVLAAVIIGVLYFTGQITGTAAIILGLFAIVFLLTSAIGFCPLYLPMKLSTIKKKDA
jgi:hypothetical protein